MRFIFKWLGMDRWTVHVRDGRLVWRRLNLETWKWEYREMTEAERSEADAEYWVSRSW